MHAQGKLIVLLQRTQILVFAFQYLQYMETSTYSWMQLQLSLFYMKIQKVSSHFWPVGP